MAQSQHPGTKGRVCGLRRQALRRNSRQEGLFPHYHILGINQPLQIYWANIIFKALYKELQKVGRRSTRFCPVRILQCDVKTREIPHIFVIKVEQQRKRCRGKVPWWVWKRKAGGIRVRRPGFSPGLTTCMILNKVADHPRNRKWKW